MKSINFIGIVALASAFALACQTPSGNTNVTVSHDHGNMNSNSMGIGNHDMANMSHDMSNMDHDMSGMDHDMSKMESAPGAANQPYDLQFIDSMIHHHQGAVMMSKMALQKTENAELKRFLQKIIDDQDKEIARMKEWRDTWYPGKPSALNMEMPGMKMGSEKMNTSSHEKEMQVMAGKDFDMHFIDMMIPHHEGAIAMAKDALQKAEHAEIKTLSNEVIREQEAEIKKMREWKAQWGK